MNRPTDELENLLSLADEAMAEGDYNDAVMILRRASSVAPLRRDVKNRLALALEGAPVRAPQKRTAAPSPVLQPVDNYADAADGYEDYDTDDVPAAEPIADVARKAFRAAAGTTVKASSSARHLSNLLQNGLKSWKSSLLDQIQPMKGSAAPESDPAAVTAATEAGLFTAPEELNSYIGTPVPSSHSTYTPAVANEPDQEDAAEEERLVKPAPVSRKSSKSAASKKNSDRPTDMEDVIAAGIGSLIEAVSRTNKKSFVYAGVYMAMGAFITLACVDASKKFPGVQAVPGSGGGVAMASMGALDLSGAAENPITRARHLASIGKSAEAITLLKSEMNAGAPKASVDPIRVELAAQLNGAAEEKLRGNQLKESANLYREAVGVMPGDSGLALRLANSLYYLAIMDTVTAAEKKETLAEARDILDGMVTKGSDNVQVYRLLALLHEAEGHTSQAKASWQKVKAMAAANSPEHTEAVTRLK